MSDYRIGALVPEQVARVWPAVEGYIARALKRGQLERAYYPFDILAHLLKDPLWKLWVVTDGEQIHAAVVTRIIQHDRCHTCLVFLLGGKNMKAWLHLVTEETEKYARSLGCIAMECGGREGWVRVAGYKMSGPLLIKEL